MGLFIGHELTHAFTFEDLPLDENGANTRWWSDMDQFEDGQKSACFIDHYDNFTTDNDDDDEHEVSIILWVPGFKNRLPSKPKFSYKLTTVIIILIHCKI